MMIVCFNFQAGLHLIINYLIALSHGLRTSIRDEYSNALNFCHGDIYRQIRFYQDRGRKFEEGRWFARLNPSMSSDLLRFQKRKDFEDLRYALDSLLQFPGLWPAFKIGCSRRLFNMHQPEVGLNYSFAQFQFFDSRL